MPTPSCTASPISRSCAARRIRRSWSCRRSELGYAALAITDECSLAGVVRAHVEAKTAEAAAHHRQRIPARGRLALRPAGDRSRELRPTVRADHARPAQRTQGQLSPHARRSRSTACPAVSRCGCPDASPTSSRRAGWRRVFRAAFWIAAERLLEADDASRCKKLSRHRRSAGPAGRRGRRRAHACPRSPRAAGHADGDPLGDPVAQAGYALLSQRRAPSASARTRCSGSIRPHGSPKRWRIAERCRFSLDSCATNIRKRSCPRARRRRAICAS